jgi:4-hydroxythreonine-4-phosphate dehydrogenase
MPRLPIAVTMGEPAGIGGEITMKAWAARNQQAIPSFFALDDPSRLAALSDRTGIKVQIEEILDPEEANAVFPRALPVLSQALDEPSTPACIDPANGPAVIRSIKRAVDFVFEGKACAVVTNPIQKSALYENGFEHPGHTEFLAQLCQDRTGRKYTPVMMLAADGLLVVPLTIHVPLRDVAQLITQDLITKTVGLLSDALQKDFAMPNPRIAITGLNPHAGEAGTLGREETDVIEPAIATLQEKGIAVSGPHPADALFHNEARMHYDAALAMYHDQALIPIKTLNFDKGVNITLGLPIIRTSPDHGTALDLAGTGRASPGSFIEALHTARLIFDIHTREKTQ